MLGRRPQEVTVEHDGQDWRRLAIAGYQPAGIAAGVVWGLVLSVLMASRVPYPRFTCGRLGQLSMLLAALFVVALAFDGKLALAAAQVGLVAYVVWGLVRGIGLAAVGERPARGGPPAGD